MVTITLSPRSARAVAKHTLSLCVKAYQMHEVDGEGARTIGVYLGLTTRQADAVIDAGREYTTLTKGNLDREDWDDAILAANCRGAAWCVYPKLEDDPDLDATTTSLWRNTNQ